MDSPTRREMRRLVDATIMGEMYHILFTIHYFLYYDGNNCPRYVACIWHLKSHNHAPSPH